MHELRRQIRKQRKQLSSFQQVQAENFALNHLRRFHQFQSAKHIGIYLDAFGEVKTKKIIELAFQQSKRVYLPVICNMNKKLVWVEISQHQYRNKRFANHILGMQEPRKSRGFHVNQLDLLILPLLACDAVGTRIGMGGGFYDKTLANSTHKPYRLGLAHEFQYIRHKLQRQTWDQPLDALLTPTKLYRFKR